MARVLLPLVEDDTWFFDTELLVLAERSGLRIHEVPVDWVDDPDSRVDVVRTALDDLRGIRRLGWGLLTGRVEVDRLREQLGVRRASGSLGTQIAIFARSASPAPWRTPCSSCCCATSCPPWPPTRRSAADRDRQHRGQPPVHLRGARPVRGGPAPRQGLLVFGIGLGLTSVALWLLDSCAARRVAVGRGAAS